MKNYAIYKTSIKGLNTAPFEAVNSLFKFLDIPFTLLENKQNDLGFHKSYVFEDEYSRIFKQTLENAKKDNLCVIATENSSFLGLQKANSFYDFGVEILNAYDIIYEKLTLEKKDLIHTFEKFNCGIYYGSDDEILSQNVLLDLMKFTKIKIIDLETKYKNDGYNIVEFDKDRAYKMAGEIVFDAFDNSCDFLVINDIRSFEMFDSSQKKLPRAIGRPLEAFPILSVAQVLLMAFGKIKPEENFTNQHLMIPKFI